MIKQIKKIFCFSTLFSSLLYGCYKPVNKENKDDQKRIDDAVGKDNNPVIEYDPLIKSDEYHQGYVKRKYSTLFSYEPHITYELPRLDIKTDLETKNYFDNFVCNSLDDKYSMIVNGNIAYKDCSFSLTSNKDTYSFENKKGQIKFRGNGSLTGTNNSNSVLKKPYSIKFNEKISILGINNDNKFKKWVLNPFYLDPSLLREPILFYLAKQLLSFDNIWSPDFAFVDLYFNDIYSGIYCIEEKIEVGKNRINIDDIEKREPFDSYSEIDTGYIFEYDGYGIYEERYNTNPIFRIDYNQNSPLKTLNGQIVYQSYNGYLHNGRMLNEFTVKSDIYSQSQLDFLSSYVGNVYKIIYEAVYNKKSYTFDSDYTNIIEKPELSSFEAINNVINIDSFVDKYLLMEIACDQDLYWNTYFQLDMSNNGDNKIAMSSVWDLNLSCGFVDSDRNNVSGFNPNYLYVANQKTQPFINAWYLILIHEDWFWDLVKEKWKLLVDNGVLYNSLHYIDEFSIVYKKAFEKNFSFYPALIATSARDLIKNYGSNQLLQSQYLFSWLARRYNYLNTVFGDGTILFTY